MRRCILLAVPCVIIASWILAYIIQSGAIADDTEEVPLLIKKLESSNQLHRREASWRLKALGPDAMDALPKLLECLEDKEIRVRMAVARAILAIDPDQKEKVCQVLAQELKNPDPKIRYWVVSDLAELGDLAASCSAPVAEALTDEDQDVRDFAEHTLKRIGIRPEAIPILLKALQHADWQVRYNVVDVLGSLRDKPGREVLTALTASLKDAHPAVRAGAAEALLKADPKNEMAQATAENSLKEKDWLAKLTAGRCLLSLNREDAAVRDTFATLLQHEDVEVRTKTVRTLGDLAGKNDTALKLVALGLKDKDANIVGWATRELEDLGPRAQLILPAVVEALSHKDGNVRGCALDVLAAMGPGARSAVPAIAKFLRDEDPFVARDAAITLLKVDPENKSGREVLEKALTDPESRELRRKTAASLTGVDPIPETLTPLLGQALTKDTAVRDLLAKALGNVRKGQKTAVPFLIFALGDSNLRTRLWAAESLARYSSDAADAVPALIKALEDPDRTVRSAAAEALGQIGEKASDAVPKLIARMRGDWSGSVREKAAGALGKIGVRSEEVLSSLESAQKDKDKRVKNAAEGAVKKLQDSSK